MLGAHNRADAAYEPAPLGLRIAGHAIDSSIGSLALTVVSFAAIDSGPANAISMRSWQERLDDLWFADFALSMYTGGLAMLVFRFLVSLLFGTTPGRNLTGLRIVANADACPAGRGPIALRDFIALVLFAIPVLNAVWIVFVFRDSKKPGWTTGSPAALSRKGRGRRVTSIPGSRTHGRSRGVTRAGRLRPKRAPLGLRIGAFVIDGWVVLTALSLWRHYSLVRKSANRWTQH